MTTLQNVIEAAQANLSPRASYAREVIQSSGMWSGANLKGSARRFSGGYHQQRLKARLALEAASGCVLGLRRHHGKLTTAVRLCVDDFGVEVYDTVEVGLVSAAELR